jgi:hypothetical protein
VVVEVVLTEILVVMETNHQYHHHKEIMEDKQLHPGVLPMLLVVVVVLAVLATLLLAQIKVVLEVLVLLIITGLDLISLMPVVAVEQLGQGDLQVLVDLVVVVLEEIITPLLEVAFLEQLAQVAVAVVVLVTILPEVEQVVLV